MKIKLDKKFAFLDELDDIPKKLHVSWKSPQSIIQSKNPMIINGILNAKDMNPEYKIEISSDVDVDEYIQSNIPSDDYNLIKNKYIVEKIDLWRLLKMYIEGGIYMDIDRYCNIPFRDLIKPGARCVLPTHKDKNFSQDLMITSKGNPLYLNAIAMNLLRRKTVANCNIYYLGPITYMHAVTVFLYGKMLNENEISAELFENIRNELNESKYFQSFRESDGGCDGLHRTFIFDPARSSFKVGDGGTKADFYNENNVKYWFNI